MITNLVETVDVFLLRLGHVKDSGDNVGAGPESLWGENMSHKWCSARVELNLVWVEFELVLRETI